MLPVSTLRLAFAAIVSGSSLATAAEIHLLIAADGSGSYTRIQDAIAAVPSSGVDRYVLDIKPGTYTADYNAATQTINQFKVTQPNVTFRGLGNSPQSVVLTGSYTVPQTTVNGSTLRNDTYGHATAVVTGANFSAYNLTFANTAGQSAGQAPGDVRQGRQAGVQQRPLPRLAGYASHRIRPAVFQRHLRRRPRRFHLRPRNRVLR